MSEIINHKFILGKKEVSTFTLDQETTFYCENKEIMIECGVPTIHDVRVALSLMFRTKPRTDTTEYSANEYRLSYTNIYGRKIMPVCNPHFWNYSPNVFNDVWEWSFKFSPSFVR
jgi:hypothetical protein